MDDSRPYTIPYSGSRSRSGTEGFAPASQPPPARKMGGAVAAPQPAATVADGPPPPSNHGTGPSTMGKGTTEQACNAYLGPAKYRCQSVVDEPPADSIVHLAENTVESSADKQAQAQADGEDSRADDKPTEPSSTLAQSMDGACDEPNSPGPSSKQSEGNQHEILSECRPCRLFLITHDGQGPEFCARCKMQELRCSLCGPALRDTRESSQTADRPEVTTSSQPPQQRRDLEAINLKVRDLQAQFHQQTQRSINQINGVTFLLNQGTQYSQQVMQYAAGLEGRIMTLTNLLRDQQAVIADMGDILSQLSTSQEERSAAVSNVEAQVRELTHGTSSVRDKVDRFGRQLHNLQTRVSGITHRIFPTRSRKTGHAAGWTRSSDPEANDDWVNV